MRKDHKPHPLYPWLLVSSDGDVFSTKAKKTLKPYPNHRGYLYVSAWFGGSGKRLSIARAVLDAHVGLNPAAQSSHLNGCKTDNRIENLAWETARENCARRLVHGHTPKGSRNGFAVLDERCVLMIRSRNRAGETMRALARDYGVHPSTISLAVRGVNWGHIGIAAPRREGRGA